MSGIKVFTLNIAQITTDFFTKGHERTLSAKKNIAFSFLIKGVSILINLALVPLTINYINPTQYGIWLTLSSIIVWFSFFDIGFGHGLRNRFAESKATGNYEKAKIYVSTTYAVLTLIFTGVWILFFAANFFVDWSKILNTPAELAKELSTMALIVFSFFCLQIVLKTINTIIVADQKPAKAAFFDMLGQLIALIAIYILTLKTQGSLVNLGLALGIAPILVLIFASFILFKSDYKYCAPSLQFVDFSHARDIMSLGLKFFFIQFSAIIIFQTSNIVISQILDPKYVTNYNIAFKYFSILSMTFMIVISPFWSAFTEAYKKQDFKWMKSTITKLKLLWLFLIPVTLILIFFAKTSYNIWVGDTIEISSKTSILMAIYILISIRFNLFIYLINGIGKIKLQLYINLLISLIYIPIAIYTCRKFGIDGIIGANILVAIVHAIFGQIQISRLMNLSAVGIWNK